MSKLMQEYRYRIVGGMLEDYRTSRGMSLTALGKVIGVSRNALHRYEIGKQRPTNATLAKLARYYGEPEDHFLGLVRYRNCDVPDNAPDNDSAHNAIKVRAMMASQIALCIDNLTGPALIKLHAYANLLVHTPQYQFQLAGRNNPVFYGQPKEAK